MGWGPVKSIGTAFDAGGAGPVTVTPSSAVPAGALIVVGIQDNNAALITSSQVTDSAGNTYTIALSTVSSAAGALAGFYSTNANGISTSQSISYSKQSVATAIMTACYSSNSLKYNLDATVTRSTLDTSLTPSVTSGVPKDAGELFFGLAAESGTLLTLSQDSGHGWAFPPNDQGDAINVDLMGGNKIATTAVSQTFSPGSTASVAWVAGIFSFQQNNQMSFYEPLSEPVRAERAQLLPSQRFHYTDGGYYALPGSQFMDIYPLLSEPVRMLPMLPRGAPWFVAEQINYIQYSFSLTDAFDAPAITVNAYSNINAAQVAITEVDPSKTRVTINEIRFTRGYS